ncbi:MAG TPA: hypothetical protein VFG11_08370, partial [Acidobacteriota bacterium]|nr:hypothetical protein [Acidobacteriota bacterium]
MIIIYPVNTTFPSPRANTIQILQTANALAAAGHDVHLLAKRGQTTEAGIFEYYGLSPNPTLTLHLIPEPRLIKSAKGHESLVLKRTLQVLSHFRNQRKVVFTRDPL